METERMALARLPPIGSPKAHHMSPRSAKKYEGLTGPVYTIGSKTLRYNLPPPGVLKPYQDTSAGALDTWPAHATGGGNTSAVALTKDKQLRVVDDEAVGKSNMIPKPKFLDQLETFLKKELKALGVAEVVPSELRLQAHREVFEYLIEDFKTYKPLLSAIKNEYEMMLAYQGECIRQMEPLRQMLVTVSEQCDQKIMALREEEKQEVLDLKKENQNLYQKIEDMREDTRSLETQVEKLQEELAAEYLRYRDECDARKMLIADINDLRDQQDDVLMSKQSAEELDEGEQDDPLILRIALRKSREDEAAATKRLNDMIANYGDVIPRRDYETLEKKHLEMMDRLELLEEDFTKLKDEHETLLEVHRQVVTQRDEYYVESENLRRSATPRPDWSRCADHIAGGILRWKELSDSKTSDQLVEVLLQEISGGAGSEALGADYFEGKGIHPQIPKYLQYEGKVRNRRLNKRDTSLMVKDIWREKMAHDAQKADGHREKMADFLHTYLKQHFSLEQMVAEWGYNLHDAAQRYGHDANIGLFWSVLVDEVDEDVYHSQLQLIARLLDHLSKLDVDKGNQGTLSRDNFKLAMEEYFLDKDEDNIQTLVRAIEIELNTRDNDTFDYKSLFMEDDEGKTGPFLEELKKQHKQEKIKYVKEIKSELSELSLVAVEDLRKAITTVDPHIDRPDLDRYMCWAFSTEQDELDTVEAIDKSTLIKRLKKGNIQRIGRRT